MPLKKGKSSAVRNANFHEVRHGEQFNKTAKKYGKKKAIKQMVAIVLSKSGDSRKCTKRSPKKGRRK